MKHVHLRAALAALLVPLVATPALAAKPRPAKPAKEETVQVERHKIDADDIKAAATVPVTLAAAIAAAEEKTGGKLVDIVLDADAKGAAYETTLVKDGAILRAKVDATSGAVQTQPTRKSKDDRDTLDQAKALTPDVTDLKALVGAVEEQHGAKAVEADVQLLSGYVIYDMQLAKDGKAERVAIEARSGRPIGNPGALGTD